MGVLLLLALAAGGGAWRLSQGPVDLSGFEDLIAGGLQRAAPGSRVLVSGVTLAWNTAEQRPTLAISRLTVWRPDVGRPLHLRGLDLEVSKRALGLGRIAPARVRLDRLRLEIERDAGGGLRLSALAPAADGQEGPAGSAPEPEGGPLDLMRLADALDGDALFPGAAWLQEATVRDASVVIRDQALGLRWELEGARASLRRTSGNVALEIAAPRLGENGSLVLGANLTAMDGALKLRARFYNTALGALPSVLLPGWLDAVPGARLEGNAEVEVAAPFDLRRGSFDIAVSGLDLTRTVEIGTPRAFHLTAVRVRGKAGDGFRSLDIADWQVEGQGRMGGSGQARLLDDGAWRAEMLFTGDALNPGFLFDRPLDVRDGLAHVTWRPADGSLALRELALRVGSTGVSLSGEVQPGGAYSAQGRLETVTVEDLVGLWPIGLPGSGRAWIAEHVEAARVPEGRFTISGAPGAEPEIDLQFGIEGARVRYVPTMPPLEEARGQGRLTARTLEIDVEEGRIADLSIREGHFVIPELGAQPALGEIALAAEGAAASLLRVLDAPPLGLPSKVDLAPDAIGGSVRGRMNLSLPLVKDLPIEAVLLDSTTEGRGLSLGLGGGDYAVSEADLVFNATQESLRAAGPAKVNGVPVEIAWSERFSGPQRDRSVVEVMATLDDEARQVLDIDVGAYVSGPVGVRVVKRGLSATQGAVSLEADLSRARVRLPEIGWTAAQRGDVERLAVSARLDGAQTLIDTVDVAGPGLTVSARDIELAGREVRSIYLDRFVAEGAADVRGALRRTPEGGVSARLEGRFLNVGALLAGEQAGGQARAAAPREGAGATPYPPLNLDARIGTVRIAEGLVMRDAEMRLANRAGTPDLIEGNLTFRGASPVRLTWQRTSPGERLIGAESEDAGAILRALDLYGGLAGGTLSVRAALTEDAAGETRIAGRAEIDGAVLKDAPTFAKVLTLASLTGIANRLAGEGIDVSEIEVPFAISGERIAIDDAIARGPALGLTLRGMVDRRSDTLALGGTIVPAYGINTLVGNIPLLGRLLTSREGEGVFGITYQVTGPVADPQVSVNPLSALAPGILRRLFDTPGTAAGPGDGQQPLDIPAYPEGVEGN
ncbi:YhdP family protein [Futiania mangrovi]|uniref:DUF3971 domain-containing protein n=1 Tax=Futiania mangrovi TaxID=2959716 RepID=A0A9J6PHY2_9PROT|nr:AsmA-like C-terminal region-containing protein [Futiania mangrovii]MCP1335690.1 DUF3971 domain-containing protein [Futiania mangrovii]